MMNKSTKIAINSAVQVFKRANFAKVKVNEIFVDDALGNSTELLGYLCVSVSPTNENESHIDFTNAVVEFTQQLERTCWDIWMHRGIALEIKIKIEEAKP